MERAISNPPPGANGAPRRNLVSNTPPHLECGRLHCLHLGQCMCGCFQVSFSELCFCRCSLLVLGSAGGEGFVGVVVLIMKGRVWDVEGF